MNLTRAVMRRTQRRFVFSRYESETVALNYVVRSQIHGADTQTTPSDSAHPMQPSNYDVVGDGVEESRLADAPMSTDSQPWGSGVGSHSSTGKTGSSMN